MKSDKGMGKQVTIIGGGVIGLCSAYYLKKKGFDVRVIDRGNITAGTSFGNAGYISPSHFIPLASPGIVSMGLRWMLNSSSPFYIKPRLNADLLRWGMMFWRSATQQKMQGKIPHLLNILCLSRDLTSALRDDLGNHFRMAELGCFMLYKSVATERHELALATQAENLGIETRILNGKEIQSMEPEVEVTVRGGVLYPNDCHLHPGDFMLTLKRSLDSSGVEFLLDTEVRNFETSGSSIKSILTTKGNWKCDELLIAAGSWLPLLTQKLGLSILLQAGKGYSITYPNVGQNLRRPAILVDHRVALTPMGSDLRMGGTMEISGINEKILLKRVRAIFQSSRNYYPRLPVTFPEPDRIWSGLRPLSPDGLPYIGRPGRYKNLTIAGGHAMLGLSLAAATGKLVEEVIGDQKTTIDISAFAIDRFN